MLFCLLLRILNVLLSVVMSVLFVSLLACSLGFVVIYFVLIVCLFLFFCLLVLALQRC